MIGLNPLSDAERFQIRLAKSADANTLASLAEQLGYPSSLHAITTRLETLLHLDDHALFVAHMAGQVCGWVHVFTAHRLESDDFAEIGGLVVDATRRGQGIGRALVGAAEAWALSQGLNTVRVRSNVVRTGAHRFYTRLGYASLKQSTVFVRFLEPRG